jgi:hypothetical protein
MSESLSDDEISDENTAEGGRCGCTGTGGVDGNTNNDGDGVGPFEYFSGVSSG